MLAVWSVLLWLNLAYCTTFFLPPSRRLANYAFFAWTLAYNLSILTLFLFMEMTHLFIAQKKVSWTTLSLHFFPSVCVSLSIIILSFRDGQVTFKK
jgi:hypothetical protein